MHSEIQSLDDAFVAVQKDAESLIAGLTEVQAAWRPNPAAWSVAECLDHLALTNRIYLATMQPAAAAARRQNKMRRRAALPGFFGAKFVSALEPPPKIKSKAPNQSSRAPLPACPTSPPRSSPLTLPPTISSAPMPTSTSPPSLSKIPS